MKKRSKRTEKPFAEPKEVKCYFQFVPPAEAGEPISDDFFCLNLDAQRWKLKQDQIRHAADITEQERALTVRKKAQAKQVKEIKEREQALAETAHGKLWLGISAMIKEEIGKDPAKYDAQWLAKKEESFRDLGIYELAKMELEAVALQNKHKSETGASKREIASLERECAREHEILKADRMAVQAVATMLGGLKERRKNAVDGLLSLATWITVQLQKRYKSDPELFCGITAMTDSIPVMAGLNPHWEKEAKESLLRLKVGNMRAESRLKPIAYDTDVHVCRAWAREVVKCMDANRSLLFSAANICEYLHKTWKFVSYSVKLPEWMDGVCKLRDFDRTTAREWASVARHVIRDEIPKFHERPEFARTVADIKGRYRDAPGKPVKRDGTIRSKILDKIGEAIESIAGEKLPEK